MKISEIFSLNKTQRELDFIDIDTEIDIPLFLDPYFLSTRYDAWSTSAYKTIQSYFQCVIKLLKDKKYEQAASLFHHLSEPNETCLGVSSGNPKGRGVGQNEASKIFEHIVSSKAIETGIVSNLEDIPIFVENIGKDKISDLTTNVLRMHLIKYTQEQCKLHNIPLTKQVPSGHFWDRERLLWDNISTDMLVIDGKKILLIPKGIVSYSVRYTPERYLQHFILNFLQSEHVRLRTSLVRIEKLKNGKEKIHPPSKDLLRQQESFDKSYLRDFTKRNPDIFHKFTEDTKKQLQSIRNEELDNDSLDTSAFIDYLINRLQKIPSGTKDATEFHKHILGLLSFLFYPNLICPIIENEIHDGRKRIDLTFDNAAPSGFFYQLHDIRKIPCQYIVVECKNYTSEIANAELDQLAGRFSPNRGMVGFLICREIKNKGLFLKRCTDTYKDGRGTIIPLDDYDLINVLKQVKKNGSFDYVNDFLNEKMREIILN